MAGCLLLLSLALATSAHADKKALIIAGTGGNENFIRKFAEQAKAVDQALRNRYGYQASDVVLLLEAASDSNGTRRGNSGDAIRASFRALASDLRAGDVLFVFLIGHGTFDGRWAKFNIDGPDLRDIDYANLLDQLPTPNIVFINMSSASGPFLEKLSRKDRVIITATRSGIERNATRFAEHFLSALQNDAEADLNKDGELSVTEAFIYARDNLVRDYADKGQLRPEHPLLDDTGSGEGTETPDLLSGDGGIASRLLFKKDSGAMLTQGEGSKGGQPVDSPEKKRLLQAVQALQARKSSMTEDEYYRQFEKIMLELARLNQKDTTGTQR